MEKNEKKYQVVIRYINDLINNGKIPDNNQIPTENELAETLKVSRVTVRRALKEMICDNTIVSKRGKGSFVKNIRPNSEINNIPFIITNKESFSRFFDIYNGVQKFFQEKNTQLLLSVSSDNFEQEKLEILKYKNQGYKHMIIIPSAVYDNSAFYYNLYQEGIKFVFVDQKPRLFVYNHVHSNNFMGGFEITKLLLDSGHCKIGFLSYESPKFSSSTYDRLLGYQTALHSLNIDYDENLVACDIEHPILEFAYNLYQKGVTAIFCANDNLALNISSFFHSKGISVPEDISIVGFDNLPASSSNITPITTVNQNFYQIGYKAAELMHDIITNKTENIVDCSVPVNIVLRNSVKQISPDEKHCKVIL